MKAYCFIGGGLGDLFRGYFTDDFFKTNRTTGDGMWGRLDELCAREHFEDIKVIGRTANVDQCEQFFRYHPHVTSVDVRPWAMSGDDVRLEYEAKGYVNMRALIDFNVPWIRPKVFLSETEQLFMSDIKKPYALLYPFAGLRGFEPYSFNRYSPLNFQLEDLGYSVYAIGGSYLRQGVGGYVHNVQHNPHGAIDCLNLGARLSAQLTIEADVYIGTFSCYCMIAQAFEKRTIILHEEQIAKHFESSGSADCWAMHEPFTHAVSTVNRPIDEVTNEVIKIVKGE